MMNEIRKAFNDNKLAVYASAAILFIFLILGYFLHPNLHAYLSPVVDEMTRKVQSGELQITFSDIFINNLSVILRMFVFGLFFCFSALILAFNGFFVGYYIGTSDNLLQVILYIIPHGIFEFSSCILACASGFVLFSFLVNFLRSFLDDETYSIVNSLKNAFAANYVKLKQAFIIFGISVILMVIAGFVEAYLTIPIAETILSMLS